MVPSPATTAMEATMTARRRPKRNRRVEPAQRAFLPLLGDSLLPSRDSGEVTGLEAVAPVISAGFIHARGGPSSRVGRGGGTTGAGSSGRAMGGTASTGVDTTASGTDGIGAETGCAAIDSSVTIPRDPARNGESVS